jgi:hypothetical protein
MSFGADALQEATFEENYAQCDIHDPDISFRQKGRIIDVKHK